ncbi:MAG: lysylphosphatidylglycerol synthase domain-containing protein [Rickettsiales bacterium]|jgi:phosphatidylglycerol lysyltransferase|nr:lysylphosphatidylglycerol synthase domain-containing protein [Rickettsiales bacterium]
MSANTAKVKRLFKKIVSWAGLFFFLVAAGMLYWQLRNYSLYDIARALWHIPFINLVWASIACLTGYIALSFYDFLALRYIGKMVAWWKWMLAGMLGFAISNNAGHAVVSGGAIRYRLYTRWRIRAGEIVKILTFNGFTYFLGCAAIMICGYFMVPHDLFSSSIGASIGIHGLFLFCCASLGAYFAMTAFFAKKTIKIGELHFAVPTTRQAIFQMTLGLIDSALAGLVLYFCLIPFVELPFTMFIGIFVIAQTAGVFSQVPGGIGVFESIFLLALPGDVARADIFGALLAFRIIYYVIPLIGAGGLFLLYENLLRARMKRWLAEAKAATDKLKSHIPKLPKLPGKR